MVACGKQRISNYDSVSFHIFILFYYYLGTSISPMRILTQCVEITQFNHEMYMIENVITAELKWK